MSRFYEVRRRLEVERTGASASEQHDPRQILSSVPFPRPRDSAQGADVYELPQQYKQEQESATEFAGFLPSDGPTELMRVVHRVFLSAPPRLRRVVVFQEVEPANGPNHICARVAETLATESRKVCILDANPDCPTLHDYFGLKNDAGVMDALSSTASVAAYVRQVRGLSVMTSGYAVPEWKNLIRSEAMRKCIDELRERYDHVLIESPPYSTCSEVTLLSNMGDGVLMIVEANSTRRDWALRAKRDLQLTKANVLGAVLYNCTSPIPSKLYARLLRA